MSRKLFSIAAAALLAGGLVAAEQAKEAAGERRPPQRQREPKLKFSLTEAESAAIKAAQQKAEELAKAYLADKNDEKLAALKKQVEVVFDTQLKAQKAAAARLTDENAKKQVEKFIERREKGREKAMEMLQKRLLGEKPEKAANQEKSRRSGRGRQAKD